MHDDGFLRLREHALLLDQSYLASRTAVRSFSGMLRCRAAAREQKRLSCLPAPLSESPYVVRGTVKRSLGRASMMNSVL